MTRGKCARNGCYMATPLPVVLTRFDAQFRDHHRKMKLHQYEIEQGVHIRQTKLATRFISALGCLALKVVESNYHEDWVYHCCADGLNIQISDLSWPSCKNSWKSTQNVRATSVMQFRISRTNTCCRPCTTCMIWIKDLCLSRIQHRNLQEVQGLMVTHQIPLLRGYLERLSRHSPRSPRGVTSAVSRTPLQGCTTSLDRPNRAILRGFPVLFPVWIRCLNVKGVAGLTGRQYRAAEA